MRTCLLAATLAFASAGATAATPGPALYSVNSAAIASAMTYCSTKYGNLQQGSPGQACFVRARGILAAYGLREVASGIESRCQDPNTFNTCLTPEIGRLVYALNAEFVKQKL